MKLVIPTYRRQKQLTWSFLSKEAKKNTVFVCDEKDTYKLAFLGLSTEQMVIHGPEVKTIANKMAWIFRNLKEEKILLLDDDLRFAYRRDGWESTKLYPATHEEMDTMFEKIEKELDVYAQVALGPRQGNNTQKVAEQIPGKAMYAIGYNIPEILKHCALDRIEYRADYDYTLQLLTKGFPNKILHMLTTDQAYNNPGGCSEQRTIEANDRDTLLLESWFPGIVKAVDKEYKGSLNRKEVIVQWKAALGQGESAREASDAGK